MRHFLKTFAAAAAISALGGATALGSAVPPAAASPVATGTHWTSVATGAPKPRRAVPWKRVGTGWVVALVAGTHHTARLMLFSPSGQGYFIRTVPADDRLVDVSPDGRAVILVEGAVYDRVVDLTTGHEHVAQKYAHLRFSRTAHPWLVVLTGDFAGKMGQVTGLQRRDVDGRILARAGAPDWWTFTVSTDGRAWLVDEDDGVHPVDPSTLREGHAYPTPRGYDVCDVAGRWDATTFLESCSLPNGTDELFMQKIAGGAPVPLTVGIGPASAGYGVAFRTSLGPLVLGEVDLAGGRVRPVTYLLHGKHGTAVTLPRPYAADYTITDAAGTTLLLTATSDTNPDGAATPNGVALANLATHRILRVAGDGTRVPGTILDVQKIHGR